MGCRGICLRWALTLLLIGTGHGRDSRELMVRESQQDTELDTCPRESPSFHSLFSSLTISREPGSRHGAKDGAVAGSRGCGRAGSGAATATPALFEPGRDGQSPRVVVLVGAPGMGKTTMVRKVMVEWREGTLHTHFDFVFCLDCKAIVLPMEASVADLVSQGCPGLPVPAGEILEEQKRILFILDGFEALGFSLLQPEAELSSDPREVKPLELTLMSLLKKTVLPKASLLITTRPRALGSLRRCLKGEHSLEIVELLGFSAATREEYFHRYFEKPNTADMALRFARGNQILYSLCAIPVISWTVCTILQQELCGKKKLLECSRATTGMMMMFYLSQLLKPRHRDKPQVLQHFLVQLCSLAAEGIWKHKVLFEEKEIKDCGLDQPALLHSFLNEKIPGEGEDRGSVYAFTHLHLQEFFAAMFYLLEDDGEMVSSLGRLEKDVKKLLESYKCRKDLKVTVRFLFGLVSQKSIEYMDKSIGCRISPGARQELLDWLQDRHRGLSQPGQALKLSEMDTFHFLFEMNEESFTQSALCHFTALHLQDTKLSLYDQMALSFCIQHWAGLGCLTLQGCSFHWHDPEAQLDASGPW